MIFTSGRVGAVVLAGGRSNRLGGFPKSQLQFVSADGSAVGVGHGAGLPEPSGRGVVTLLDRTIEALLAVGVPEDRIVVVGPPGVLDGSAHHAVAVTREDPPFSGPVAGISAGVQEMFGEVADRPAIDLVFTLACDMPGVGAGIRALLDAAGGGVEESVGVGGATAPVPGRAPGRDRAPGPDRPESWVGLTPAATPTDEDRVENLVSLHRTPALVRALQEVAPVGLSVRRLLARLDVQLVPLPSGAADDADTWVDAARLGLQ